MSKSVGEAERSVARRPGASAAPPAARLPLRAHASAVLAKFCADRGTHLAAMIAYFALLSFVPLLFLGLTLVALAGESQSSYLVDQLRRAFPPRSVDRLLEIVAGMQDELLGLSLIAGIGIVWGALGFFSAIETTLNVVYRLPNRAFIHQKSLTLLLVVAALAVNFVALVIATLGGRVVGGGGVGSVLAYGFSLAVSTVLFLLMLWVIYRVLTNTALTWRATFPGALCAAILLQLSFQMLPIFLVLTEDRLVALQAFGGLVILLIWLYFMANIVVVGAEVNWWLEHGRRARHPEPTPGSANAPTTTAWRGSIGGVPTSERDAAAPSAGQDLNPPPARSPTAR